MRIAKATDEEFQRVVHKRGVPEVHGFLGRMNVGEVVRIIDHDHEERAGNHCVLANRIRRSAFSRGMKLSQRHDGDDLLVKRVS